MGQVLVGEVLRTLDAGRLHPRGRYTGQVQADRVLLPVLEKYEVTIFCAPPTVYRMLILADLEKFDLTSLRHCVSAGEPLNPEVIRVWKEGTKLTIYEGYGQTELVLVIGTFPCMEPRPGSMGKPSPGWHIELHDEEGHPVLPGETGRIAIRVNPRPAGLFDGYLYDPEATAQVFSGDFYYTGDKAYTDDDGYFWFVGRDDDVIKSSGYRIGPFEVESALLEHPAVKEAAVVGSPDVIRGMVVKAFIVLKEGFEPNDQLAKEIQRFVKKSTAPYKYPRAIEFVPDLPKDDFRQDQTECAPRTGTCESSSMSNGKNENAPDSSSSLFQLPPLHPLPLPVLPPLLPLPPFCFRASSLPLHPPPCENEQHPRCFVIFISP